MEIDTITALTRIITAMITPVILILATSSILGITSQRLSKTLDRSRRMWEQIIKFPEVEGHTELEIKSREHLISLIKKTSKRARLLQTATTVLYLCLSLFVATSVSIGVIEVADKTSYWLPMALEISGFFLLFYATVVLIIETQIAIRAVKQETSFIVGIEDYKK